MTSLSRHICYLLRHHDCVVVPGWGAFIAHAENAVVDMERLECVAPRRWLSFSPSLTTDDGVLTRSVARRERISHTRASQIVEAEVASMKARLALDGELVLKGIGRFTASDSDASPVFTPLIDGGAANARFSWLPALEPLEAETGHDVAVTPQWESGAHIRPRFPIWGRVAAMLAVVVTLAFGIAQFMPESSGNVNYASLGVKSKAAVATSAPVVVDTVMNHPVDLAIAMPDASLATTTVSPLAIENPEAEKYYLIVASMPSERMAKKFIAWKGDSSLRILPSGPKRFRVYVAETGSYEGAAAYKKLPAIAKKYRDAWVCPAQ